MGQTRLQHKKLPISLNKHGTELVKKSNEPGRVGLIKNFEQGLLPSPILLLKFRAVKKMISAHLQHSLTHTYIYIAEKLL